MVRALVLLVFTAMWIAAPLAAQEAEKDPSIAALCTFPDDKEMSVRYQPVPTDRKLVKGRLWTPGERPLFLFTQTDLMVGSATIPVGAYAMYVMPNDKQWTLIINRNVAAGAAYDEQQDIIRQPMDVGKMTQPAKEFNVAFGHTGPNQCEMRLTHNDTLAWMTFLRR